MAQVQASFGRPNQYRAPFLPRNGVNKRESIAKPMDGKDVTNARVKNNTIKYIGSRRFQPPLQPQTLYRIQINNITPDMILDDLVNCFKRFRGIHQVWIDVDSKHVPSGTGGLVFTDRTSAQHAIGTYNGKIIQPGGGADLDTETEDGSSSTSEDRVASILHRYKTLKPRCVRKVLSLRFADVYPDPRRSEIKFC